MIVHAILCSAPLIEFFGYFYNPRPWLITKSRRITSGNDDEQIIEISAAGCRHVYVIEWCCASKSRAEKSIYVGNGNGNCISNYINSATKKELSELPKIGDVRSAAIIKGRPYKGKDELVSKKILTEDVYNGIKDRVIAKQKPQDDKKK